MRRRSAPGTGLGVPTFLGLCLLVCAPSSAADGVNLTLARGAAPTEVVLSWNGQQPDYEVYRSVDPRTLPGSAARIGQTTLSQWTDTPPVGTYWVPVASPYWQTVIDDSRTLTGGDPWVTFQIVDEWEYTPRFYRGLAQLARQRGIAGFNLHTVLSGLGELSPAMTRSQWKKIRAIPLD